MTYSHDVDIASRLLEYTLTEMFFEMYIYFLQRCLVKCIFLFSPFLVENLSFGKYVGELRERIKLLDPRHGKLPKMSIFVPICVAFLQFIVI